MVVEWTDSIRPPLGVSFSDKFRPAIGIILHLQEFQRCYPTISIMISGMPFTRVSSAPELKSETTKGDISKREGLFRIDGCLEEQGTSPAQRLRHYIAVTFTAASTKKIRGVSLNV